jgi:hypothetical protein
MKFRKKPVVIDAIQWTGNNLSEIQKFYKPDGILLGVFSMQTQCSKQGRGE